MDQAALRERRAARERQVRRRRRHAGLGGVLVVALGLVAALAAAGDDTPQPPRPAKTVAVRAPGPAVRTPVVGTPVVRKPVVRKAARPARAAALPGAHRAPREPVPILMYHVIGTRGTLTANPGLWVSPADFTAQVHALRDAGYHAVTLQEVWDAWHRHGKLPSAPVVLSFDDGYLGQVRDALPALAAVGWPGVLNLKVGNLADMGGTKAVKRLIAAGWEVDAHTITHPDLTTLGPEQLHEEVAGSRARLRRLLGVPVSFFCYPSGRYNATVIAAVKAAGFLAATTTRLGWASPAADAFALPRVRVDGGMTPDAMLQRVHEARAAVQPTGA
jgi:peptidoglycan/xylan/chitin deacetylase (PgdA/CDA1 family)